METNPKWWQNLVVYQVYPMSYQDTNNDGIGDVAGITKRLDYIQSLGVNMIWLNPIYESPKVDNGYDVSNYYAIDHQFGTMKDVDELIEEAHRRGIKIIFDFVMNHTSDQHPWFREAIKGKDNPYRDYYIWSDVEEEKEDLPNNWESFFGGSVWAKEPNGNQYYFHLFAKEMPDLNWENQNVRDAMLDIAYYWLEKGVDGFRLDAFIHVAKEPGFPDLDIPKGEVALAEQYYSNLPKINPYMRYFSTKLRERYPDIFIVGEAASADVNLARSYCDPEEGGCNAVITFRYFSIDEDHKDKRLNTGLQKGPLNYGKFKKTMAEWQAAMDDVGGPTLYWNNHDTARVVSRFGDETIYRNNSAKMLAALMYLLKGIPFIYNGEELGMKNLAFDNIDDFYAPEARGFYNRALKLGYTEDWALYQIGQTSKDAGRGVMQWDNTSYAGFSAGRPWSGVNIESAHTVQAQSHDPNSVLNFYRRVLELKRTDLFAQGRFRLLETSDNFFAYERVWNRKIGLVVCNVTNEPQVFRLPELDEDAYRRVILENEGIRIHHNNVHMEPYGAVVLQTDY